MELINKRFLYFKTYDAFLSRLDAGAIKNDSIVFIDEGDIIWTQGKIFSTSDKDIRESIEVLQGDTEDIISEINDIKSSVANIVSSVNSTGLSIDNINNSITDIVSDIDGIKDDITDIVSDIDGIKDDITNIENLIRDVLPNTSGGPASNLVTLSASAYQAMVAAGTVNRDTYYFTYEDGEGEDTEWVFGGTFPVILSGSNILGVFPIELT